MIANNSLSKLSILGTYNWLLEINNQLDLGTDLFGELIDPWIISLFSQFFSYIKEMPHHFIKHRILNFSNSSQPLSRITECHLEFLNASL